MVLRIRKPNERVANSALVRAYGVIAERIAAEEEVRRAVELVLGYEQDRLDRSPQIAVSSDIAYAHVCHAAGKADGLDLAARCLLDRDHIAQERERIEELNEPQENES